MRRRTAHVLTATALTVVAFTGPVAGVVAAADLGVVGFAPGDFAALEVWPKSAAPGATVTVNTTACGPGSHADGDATTVGGEWEHNPFIRAWRGLDPPGSERCTAGGRPATLLLRARDYDGGFKCWVRWDGEKGGMDVVPGSQVQGATSGS